MPDPMPSAKSEPEWAAFAAVDWANQKHFWRLAPADSQQQEQGELENTPEAVEVWAATLKIFGAIIVVLISLRPPSGSWCPELLTIESAAN